LKRIQTQNTLQASDTLENIKQHGHVKTHKVCIYVKIDGAQHQSIHKRTQIPTQFKSTEHALTNSPNHNNNYTTIIVIPLIQTRKVPTYLKRTNHPNKRLTHSARTIKNNANNNVIETRLPNPEGKKHQT
jgi:hypothetical protein